MDENIRSYNGAEVIDVKRFSRVTRKRSGLGRAVVRGLCLAASVLALVAFGGKVGTGISRVSRGEITAAQMFVELGNWLQGD